MTNIKGHANLLCPFHSISDTATCVHLAFNLLRQQLITQSTPGTALRGRSPCEGETSSLVMGFVPDYQAWRKEIIMKGKDINEVARFKNETAEAESRAGGGWRWC